MAVPVKKTSRTETRIRRNTPKKTFQMSIACPQCGEAKMPHRVCTGCGFYAGNKVIELNQNA